MVKSTGVLTEDSGSIPGPTWQLTTTYSVTPRGYDALVKPPHAVQVHGTDTQQARHPQVNLKK